MKQEILIGVNEKGQRLDKFLRKLFKDVQLSVIFKDIRKGNIKVNGKKQEIHYKLVENDIVKIFGYHYESIGKKSFDFSVEDYLKPRICFEDSNILVVIKDVDSIVHSNGDYGLNDLTKNVKTYLFKKGEYIPGRDLVFSPSPVNRLDRNTCGLVIFSKNGIALKELNYLMRNRRISKYYRALIEGRINDGLYKAYIRKDIKTNKSTVTRYEVKDSKYIEMKVSTIDTNGVVSLVDIKLITGRSHQIRSHFEFLGNPLVGDPKYGNRDLSNYFFNKYKVENQVLFAYKLIFNGIDRNMDMNYLNNKVVIMPFTPQFKKMVKQEFRIMVRGR